MGDASATCEDSLDSLLNSCTSDSWACPLCAMKGLQAKVRLYQANAFAAVYACETDDCLYLLEGDSDPMTVQRSLEELPVGDAAIETAGLPAAVLNDWRPNLNELQELCLIKDVHEQFDKWSRLEKTLKLLSSKLAKESARNPGLQLSPINAECTPLGHIRNLSGDLLVKAKHFIPNVEDVIELQKLGVL